MELYLFTHLVTFPLLKASENVRINQNILQIASVFFVSWIDPFFSSFRRGGAAGDQRDVQREPALLLQGCVRPAARRVALRQRHQRRRRQPPTKAVLRRARLVQTQRPKVVVVVVLIASWFWLHFVVVVFAVFIVTAPVDAG